MTSLPIFNYALAVYAIYYTYRYARMLWHHGKKFASIFIMLLVGGSLLALPLILSYI
ncbi:hypothetical protein [Caldalkalibacillus salinus]|uniref:hypothetical protein n=1 Tax=Caldalkalibacillus salinus TaxID=2803787 RepID=UPI001924916F|nr:hypothetical protein [Caldalkalibacillus salinus]